MGKKIATIVTFAVMMAVVSFSVIQVRSYIAKDQERIFAMQAKQAVLLVKAEDLKRLDSNSTDLEKGEYKRIRQDLVNFRSLNEEIRFLYILGYDKQQGKQFFMVDSEDSNSKDFSPPGQVYNDAEADDIVNHIAGRSYVKGPYTDSWGTWVSSYAPVLDDVGEIVGLVGIDVSAKVWQRQINFATLMIILVGFLFFGAFCTFINFVYKHKESIDILLKEKALLYKEKKLLRETQELAKIGKINIFFPERIFSFDEKLCKLFNANPNERIKLEDFMSYVHKDDLVWVREILRTMEISKKDDVFDWPEIRIVNQEKSFVNYHIHGILEHASLDRIVFSGVMQEK